MRLRINTLLISIILMLITGCSHNAIIEPQASTDSINRYSCDRPIKLTADSETYFFTKERFMESFKFNIGPLLKTYVQTGFLNGDNSKQPIVLEFGPATHLHFGSTSFSDNIVTIELISTDTALALEEKTISHIGKAGEPIGSAAFGAMFGMLGAKAITYPAMENQFARSTDAAMRDSLKKFGDDMIGKGICQTRYR